jgi:hypothetical protein
LIFDLSQKDVFGSVSDDVTAPPMAAAATAVGEADGALDCGSEAAIVALRRFEPRSNAHMRTAPTQTERAIQRTLDGGIAEGAAAVGAAGFATSAVEVPEVLLGVILICLLDIGAEFGD